MNYSSRLCHHLRAYLYLLQPVKTESLTEWQTVFTATGLQLVDRFVNKLAGSTGTVTTEKCLKET